jgi:hypothetical protein
MSRLAGIVEEPMSRGTIVASVAPAVRSLWGDDALEAVLARLPEETRTATTGPALNSLEWYPTRFLLHYDRAIFEGPAGRDETAFRSYLQRRVDLGFGRFRRTFLRFASPERLAQRASELWRNDQTHGELKVETISAEGARLTLRGHPYTTNPISRLAFSEVLRHILSLTRVRNVRETHALVDETLVMNFLYVFAEEPRTSPGKKGSMRPPARPSTRPPRASTRPPKR